MSNFEHSPMRNTMRNNQPSGFKPRQSNTCPKCGLYYNPLIEGSIPVNGCKCKEKRPLAYFMGNARNAAYSLVVKYTHEITKRDVRLKIMLYEETKSFPDYDREKLVGKIWREIKKII